MRPNIGNRLLFSAILLAVVSSSAPSRAQSNEALAESMFREAKRRMAAGDYEHACPLFASSQHLDPGGGTLLSLALCHEAQGKTASAWAEFEEAVTTAERDKEHEREAIARAHEAALEPSLARISIVIAKDLARTPGLRVSLDGTAIPEAAWTLATPIDPGEHRVEVVAPGKLARTSVARAVPGKTEIVRVDSLEDETRPTSVLAAPPNATTPSNSPRRVPAFLLGGAGLVSLGASGLLAIEAMHHASTAKSLCPESACTDPSGISADDAARRDASLTATTLVVGLVALAASAYLLLSDSSVQSSSASSAFSAHF